MCVCVCGCSRGCAKPHKSQQRGLSLHRRKSFLARFEHLPSTASAFPTEQQRRDIRAKALRGAARGMRGSLPYRGRASSGALGMLPAPPHPGLWIPHPSPAGPGFSALGEPKLIFSCPSPEGFFHYTGRAELPARPLARLPRPQPLAPLFQRHIVQM